MPRSHIRNRQYDLRSNITAPSQGEEYKRLIVLCDGTWVDADAGNVQQGSKPPSNVTRLSRAILNQTSTGTKQIIYYSPGVGSSGSTLSKIYSGGTGAGLAEFVRDGYCFLSQNYVPGDEIFLFGFSRGAFTARAIGGLIAEIGMLTRRGEEYFSDIYTDVRHRDDPSYKPAHPNIPFRNKPSASDKRYRAELERLGLTTLGVPIKVVGVWDTVGSLGLPRIGWLERIGLQSSVTREMEFFDTNLSSVTENAFQALALDERRASFSPAVWHLDEKNTTTRLRQVWFPGVHSNVGGGYQDQSIANMTLTWMVAQASPHLAINQDYILDEQDRTDDWYESTGARPAPWSFGRIYNSLTGIWLLGGAAPRTPGQYKLVLPSGPTDKPLRRTNEAVHASVRCRIKLNGPGPDDHGTYRPPAMAPYKLTIDDAGAVTWRGPGVDLPEAPLAPLERELLDMCAADTEMEEYVLRPRPTGQQPQRRRESRSAGA